MKTIKAKVHMLPTEGVSYIHRDSRQHIDSIVYSIKPEIDLGKILIPQHLYITTDEEIKEGDWVIQQFEGQDADVCQITYGEYEIAPDIQRKIIATTDPNISKIGYQSGKLYGVPDIEGTKFEDTRLPVIPQSFIEEYCKAGGIDEVLVELELLDENIVENNAKVFTGKMKEYIKLNTDNTIIIHPVEEKMYSREEVIKIINDSLDELLDEVGNDYEYNGCNHLVRIIIERLNQNKDE